MLFRLRLFVENRLNRRVYLQHRSPQNIVKFLLGLVALFIGSSERWILHRQGVNSLEFDPFSAGQEFNPFPPSAMRRVFLDVFLCGDELDQAKTGRNCDQNKGSRSHRELICPARVVIVGKISVTVVPRPISLTIDASPLWISIIDRTSANPKPLPLEFRDGSTR